MVARIVILGGGFAGVSAAQALVKQLRRERRLVRQGTRSEDGIDGVSVTLLARDPRTGTRMPSTAQHAIREGPQAAANVLAVLDGRAPAPFSYDQMGMLVSLGRFKGVGEVLGVKVSGFVAWFLWRTYYLLRLPTWDRRLRVALDWTLELLLGHDVTGISMRRTRTRPGEPAGEMHGEPVSVGARPDATDELDVG